MQTELLAVLERSTRTASTWRSAAPRSLNWRCPILIPESNGTSMTRHRDRGTTRRQSASESQKLVRGRATT